LNFTNLPSNNHLSPFAIEQHFKIIHSEYQSDYPNLLPFLENHLHFVTLTPYYNQKISPIDEFGRFYFRVARQLLGNNLQRKRNYQPLAYAFADFVGSRSSSSENIQINGNPHIHALMLVRPQHLKLFGNIRLCLRDFLPVSINEAQCVPFDSEKGSLSHLISYCMKGYQKISGQYSGREDLWAIFPK
jgi:hypothetical protein